MTIDELELKEILGYFLKHEVLFTSSFISVLSQEAKEDAAWVSGHHFCITNPIICVADKICFLCGSGGSSKVILRSTICYFYMRKIQSELATEIFLRTKQPVGFLIHGNLLKKGWWFLMLTKILLSKVWS